MSNETPNWGIEPVPERLRVLGLFDTTLLWSSLGLSLLVLVAGTYLVPALSLPSALAAILVGGLIGNAMLGFAGADRRRRAASRRWCSCARRSAAAAPTSPRR